MMKAELSFRRLAWLALVAAAFIPDGSSGKASAGIINATITVDNAYAFGFGDATGINNAADWHGGVTNTRACQIICSNGPESYNVNTSTHTYAYIAAWPDNQTAQGVLAGFSVGSPAVSSLKLSSATAWEVFATGDLTSSASTAFDRAAVNAQIALANSGSGLANGSVRWVDENGFDSHGNSGTGHLIRDQTNSLFLNGDPFVNPLTGGVAGQFGVDDRWMWWDNERTTNPFEYSSAGDGGWLIFRAELDQVSASVPEPSSFGLFLCVTGVGVVLVRRRRVSNAAPDSAFTGD